MKKHLLLCMVLLSANVYAQGIKFGRHYMEQKQRANSTVLSKSKKYSSQPQQKSSALIEEMSEIIDNRCYRFVYAYNKDKVRSSETIYMREKVDGKWGPESLYDVGTYSYEYDSKNRIKIKAVDYGKSDAGGIFTSYYIMVRYEEGVTYYTKYEDYGDEYGYLIVEDWSYYDNGRLASHAFFDSYSGNLEKMTTFDEEGNITGIQTKSDKLELKGSLNDSTIIKYASYWDYGNECNVFTEPAEAEHYKYDTEGRLVEYSCYSLNRHEGSRDICKYVYTYDTHGRISSIVKYNTGDDEEIGGVNDDQMKSAQPFSESEPEWVLDYEEKYTYFNDDVYGIGNSWHDVFGLDGPLTSMTVTEDEYKSAMTMTRDASGKLTAVSFKEEGTSPYGNIPTYTFTVDAYGQITQFKMSITEDNGYYYHSETTSDYIWSNGKMIREESTESTVSDKDNYEYSWKTEYAYGNNSVTKTAIDEYNTVKTYMEKKGNRFYGYQTDKYSTDRDSWWINIREIQTEDVRFVRPNVMKDYDGFSTDTTIVVSVAGRVVCVNENDGNKYDDYGFTEAIDNNVTYFNVTRDAYFSVSHEDGNTVCKDIDNRPIYILNGDRLIKEYIYFEEYDNVSPIDPSDDPKKSAKATQLSESAPQIVCEEITYHYADNGLPTGRTVVAVDENGKRTEEITIEYKYDESTGITSPELNATQGINLNGRNLGIADGVVFSVYDMQGRLIAGNVTSHTFETAGVYIITVKGGSFKLNVK